MPVRTPEQRGPVFRPQDYVYRHRHRDKSTLTDAWQSSDAHRSKLDRWCLKAIAWYQSFRSMDANGKPYHKVFHCQCTPSCSSYTADAIREYGAVKGCMKGFYRIFVTDNPLWIKWVFGKWNMGEGTLYDPAIPLPGGPRLIMPPSL
jgi:putative component of membrane protein insertase Oxa1/YidC/SpoIIIJ protein YidD